MIRAIIIDDEEKAIKSLAWELESFCKDVEVVKYFTDPGEAIGFLENQDIDCVFLDIEMPKMDGLQFLNRFPERNFLVVITTAYDHYAINALKQHVFDYLLKPIDSDDLIKTIDKVSKHLLKNNLKDSLEERLKSMLNQQVIEKKISFNVDGKIIFLQTGEIIYCKSDGNYCDIFLENGKKITITQKLKYVEEILPDSTFLRVHNSYVVNLNKVRAYDKGEGYITLTNQKNIPVSRQRKATFLNKL
ncbi:response regulator [Leptobacterium flavescens]|uniref:Response regulator n=1 Tax=Leptobacterium flavescens TaxID=472055 RepID=A0A6P0UIP4_9FLAO|nr:LytTR family DNA-binding domain-containing protein [Leptobacterium flavescens]NER12402.1 response regulator [Leptobacterium flavescens]